MRPGQHILDLLEEDPLGARDLPDGTKAYLTVLAETPAQVPDLPLDVPEGEAWQLRVVEVTDGDVLSLRRPDQPGRHYPNASIEKHLGVPATTRGWRTVERIGEALRSP